MQGMASGGYVLSMIRVWENDEANAVGVSRTRGKRKAGGRDGAPASGARTPREDGDESAGRKRVKVDEAAGASEKGEGDDMVVDGAAA